MTVLQRFLTVLLLAALVAVAWTALDARRAARSADDELATLRSITLQAEVLSQLAARTPPWAQRGRPILAPGGLSTAASDVLAAAGVPAAALASVSPAAESRIGPAGLGGVRRRAVLTIAPLTLPQLGSVLSAWREVRQDWTIASIDLSPEPSGRNGPPVGSNLPLRAVITVETMFVDLTTGTEAPGGPN